MAPETALADDETQVARSPSVTQPDWKSPQMAPQFADDASAESFQHLRRRLFRLLEEPDLALLAVDAATTPNTVLEELLSRYATSPAMQKTHNIVLALTRIDDDLSRLATENQNANEMCFQEFRATAIERGFDGGIASLSMQDREAEVNALQTYTECSQGRFYP